jgi:hypothetical protein
MTNTATTHDPATRTDPPGDPLAPVRSFLLARARADARRDRDDAAAAGSAQLARARQEAGAILADARRKGRADGASAAAAERARARREAQALLLAARRQAYEELLRRSRAGAAALRDDPDYSALRAHLTRLARERAGAAATVVEPPGGGVVATGPDRRVDCSLAALAERAVDALGVEVEGLWAP